MSHDQIFTSNSLGVTVEQGKQLTKGHTDDYLSSRLDEIVDDQKVLEAERMIVLRKALQSDDPKTLVKANTYLENLIEDQSRAPEGVSVVMDPDISRYSKGGYISKRYALSPDYLRKMAMTPIIKSIITTRQTQVSRFSRPQRDRHEYGFKIQKKADFYSKQAAEITDADKATINELTKFILNCGFEEGWDHDNFDTFLQKVTEDSLTLDAGVFEVVQKRNSTPHSFFAVDGGTIYLGDLYGNRATYASRTGQEPEEIDGYMPKWCQVIDEKIVADYYPWELCFGIRNARTDLSQNGYGRSELEDLVTIVTALLNTEKYNSNFFTQGSNPKGILRLPSGVNRNRAAELRQEWKSMVAGVNNAWRIPVLEGDGVEWIDMHKNNADMQFKEWQDYLILVACAIYKIAPEEIGFSIASGSSMFEGDKEVRLKYSKDKGLTPLLKSIEFWINKWLINPINEGFEFRFVGIDAEDEDKETERDIKLAGSVMGLREVRVKRGLDPDIDEDDMILNPQWIQWKTQQQFADQQAESEAALGEEDDVWNALDVDNSVPNQEVVKGLLTQHANNPMMKQAIKQFEQIVS